MIYFVTSQFNCCFIVKTFYNNTWTKLYILDALIVAICVYSKTMLIFVSIFNYFIPDN